MEEDDKNTNKQRDEDIEKKSSTLDDIELENNNGDSQLEPGEVKDDEDEDIPISNNLNRATITSMMSTTAISGALNETNFHNFHNKFNLSINSRRTTNNGNNTFMMQPVLGKEIARKRLKALGNFKKIQMESKNYMTPQKQKNRKRLDSQGNKNSNSHKKDKPPTPHEKAKLTKQEIEQMKKREDRAIPCLYYDAALIHRIRADSPNNSATTPSNKSTISSKNFEINMKTSSLEAIKNYDDDDDCGDDKKITSTASSSNQKKQNKNNIIRSSPSPPIARRNLNYDKGRLSMQRYRSGIAKQQQHSDFISRKSYTDNQQFFNHNFNYYRNKKFNNHRFNMASPTSRDKFKKKLKMRNNDKKYISHFESILTTSNNRVQIMYTKTKPVISYAFNPNIVVDKKFLSSPPRPSSTSSAISNNISNTNNNDDEDDGDGDSNCAEKPVKLSLSSHDKIIMKKRRRKSSSFCILNNDENDDFHEKNNSTPTNIKEKSKDKNNKKRSHEILSRKIQKLRKRTSSPSKLSNKRKKYQQKNIKNEIKPSFDGNEEDDYNDDNNDDDNEKIKEKEQRRNENDQTNEDDETTLFVEEEIAQFPLSKDETITATAEDDTENIVVVTKCNQNMKNDSGKPLISPSLLSSSSLSLSLLRTKKRMDKIKNVANTATGDNHESPDTDDYMANWEEDEETINIFESATTTLASVSSKIHHHSDESKLSERDTGIFTDTSASQLNIESDTEDGEIKDGLGTPIFVNPSPPTELMTNNNQKSEIKITTYLDDGCFSSNTARDSILTDISRGSILEDAQTPNIDDDDDDDDDDGGGSDNVDKEKIVKITSSSLISESSHLFGMQHIYEQFIQSVSEAGIDLSSEGHTATINTTAHHRSTAPSSSIIEDDNCMKSEVPELLLQNDSKNMSNSPNRTPPFSLSRRSSTASSTSSSSTSSSSSSSTDDSSTTSSSSSSSTSSTSSSPSPLASPTTIALLNDNDYNDDGNKDNGKIILTEEVTIVNDNRNSSTISSSSNKGFINLSLEDNNRIRALQKRCKMFKNLQKQSEEMDDEDKQCLLGVKKLIEAEQKLLLRKFNITKLENLIIQGGSSEDDDDGDEDDGNNNNDGGNEIDVEEKCLKNIEKIIGGDDKIEKKRHDRILENDNDDDDNSNISNENYIDKTSSITSDRVTDDKIFDTNRETIKLKIPLKASKGTPVKGQKRATENETFGQSDAEDQDFTEKLMKSSLKRDKKSSTPSRDGGDSSSYRAKRDSQSRRRSHSHSRSCSPRNYRSGDYRARSLSASPSRYRRSSPSSSDRKGSRRVYWKRRLRSPSPKKSRKGSPSDYRRSSSGRRRSRERSRYCSPPSRRRSRSPYNSRQQSHSPLRFRPPSPTTTPPQDSREASPECNGTTNWEGINRLPEEYYINTPDTGGYYYLMPPNDEIMNDDRSKSTRLYPSSYHNYTQYNPYTNEYMPMPSSSSSATSENGYQLNYGNEYISSSNLIFTYSRIPVIGTNSTTQTEYYYSNMGLQQQQTMAIDSSTSLQSGVSVNNREIGTQVSTNASNSTTQSGGGKSSTFVVQKGNVLEIVPAPVIPTSSDNSSTNGKSNDSENKLFSGVSVEKLSSTKKKSEKMKKRRSSWEEEVAKRHIMSAVLRLNKENDGVIRGILSNKTNPDMQQSKEKKKVLFADGVTPGRSSSASEDEDSPRLRKRKKKRCSIGENKENENATDASLIVEMKIDPALENAPPPPPPLGSPPPSLEQPILIRPPSPVQFLYFHYDSVVNSMYVSQIATPIPPRLLNRNFRMNPVMAGIPPPPINPSSSSSVIGETNNPHITASTPCTKTSLNEVDIKKDSISITTSTTIADEQSPIPGESNQIISVVNRNGNTSTFEQNKSLTPPINHIPVQTSGSNNHQTIIQQFPPAIIGALPPPQTSQRMIHIIGQQRVPSPILRQLSGGQLASGGIVNLRPSRRNSPRIIRPNFIAPPLNMPRSNLLPLTPGPVSQLQNRHFQQQCSLTPPHFTSPIPTAMNSPKTFTDDSSSPIMTKNLTSIVGKAIPSIVGKVVTSQQQNQSTSAVISYNGGILPSQSRTQNSSYSSIVSRSSRSFTLHPQSSLATQQFGNNNSGFNQSPRIPPQSSTSPTTHFVQQQQWSGVRPIPVVQTFSTSSSTLTTSAMSLNNEESNTVTNNYTTITTENLSPLIYPATTEEISSVTSTKTELTTISPPPAPLESSHETTQVSAEIEAV